MATKTISKGPLKEGGAKGGSGHMFGRQSAGPKNPGTSGKDQSGSGGKWAKGGAKGQVGKQGKIAKSTPGRVALPSKG